MIIDAHAHIYDRMRGRIGSGPIQPLCWGKVRLGNGQVIRILPPVAEEISFSPEVLLEYMADAGVDRAVLPDGDVLVAFWCCEDEVYNIRWVRITLD